MKCNKCGSDLNKDAKFCKMCGQSVENVNESDLKVHKMEPINENIWLGILGALLGSLAGVVAIFAFDYIGFVASLSGLIMGFCTIALYKKFAGGISIKGIVISVMIMIIMTYLAVHLTYTVQILKLASNEGISTTFTHVFKNLSSILGALEVKGQFYGSLAMVYLFTVLGAVGVITTELKSLKANK